MVLASFFPIWYRSVIFILPSKDIFAIKRSTIVAGLSDSWINSKNINQASLHSHAGSFSHFVLIPSSGLPMNSCTSRLIISGRFGGFSSFPSARSKRMVNARVSNFLPGLLLGIQHINTAKTQYTFSSLRKKFRLHIVIINKSWPPPRFLISIIFVCDCRLCCWFD